jgi:hypothetical protein
MRGKTNRGGFEQGASEGAPGSTREAILLADPSRVQLVSFYFPLPVPIVTPGESTFTFGTSGAKPAPEGLNLRVTESVPFPSTEKGFVSIRLLQTEVDADVFGIPLDELTAVVRSKNPALGEEEQVRRGVADGRASTRRAATIAECVTVLDTSADDPITAAFESCLWAAGSLSKAFRLMTRLPIPVVTQATLPPVIVYVVRTAVPPDEIQADLGFFISHLEFPCGMGADAMSPEDCERMLVYLQATREGHPGAPCTELRLESRLAHQRYGAYRESVILAHTAVEVLLDAVLGLMLWEDGVEPENAAAVVFSGDASTRLLREFHPRLGGNWKGNGSGAVARYLTVLAPLRHRTVHLGLAPTRAQSDEALQIVQEVQDHVFERLLAKKHRYKTTACVYFGLRWLEEQGQMSSQLRRHLAAADVETWLPDHNAWRERLIAALQRGRG